jgi:hypothetical protein
MEPIHVPPTPSQAFDKNRRISDLIRAQISHLKHLEDKMPAQLRQQLPQHPIVTEDDAARYIAPMTRLLRAQAAGGTAAPSAVPAAQQPIPIRPSQALDLAASAGNEATKRSAAGKPSSKSKAAPASRKEKKR